MTSFFNIVKTIDLFIILEITYIIIDKDDLYVEYYT